MVEPIIAGNESLDSRVADVAESGARIVTNAAGAVARSVIVDGKNLVGSDVALGTRVEAGLNLAADVSSVVVGPEDAVAERAAVFAVKQGVEHAPQIVEGAEFVARAAVERAPESERAASSGFDRTKTLLQNAGHNIEDLRPTEGILETKNALYKIVERGAHDVNQIRSDVADAGKEAYDKGKNFAVHADGVAKTVTDGIKKIGQGTYHEAKSLTATLSTSGMQIEKSIGVAEHSPLIERAEHLLDKGKGIFKNVSEPIEDLKKGLEAGKKVVEFVSEHKTAASVIAGAVVSEAHTLGELAKNAEHHIADSVGAVGHVASEAGHSVTHAAHEVGEHAGAAAKAIADDVKAWTPDMPFERFGALIDKIRGVPRPVASVSSDVAHGHQIGQSTTPHKATDMGHGR